MSYEVVCPRSGLYATTDTIQEARSVIRDELPGGKIVAKNPRPTLPDIDGGEDYYVGAFRAAVLDESQAPRGSSAEFKRGFKLGKKASPSDVGYAQGVYEATSDMRRAGQQLIERAREEGERIKNPSEGEEVLRSTYLDKDLFGGAKLFLVYDQNAETYVVKTRWQAFIETPDFSTAEGTFLEIAGGDYDEDEVLALWDELELARPNPAKGKRKRISTGLAHNEGTDQIVLYGEPVGPFQRSATAAKGKPDPRRAEAITHIPSRASFYRAPPKAARVVFAELGRAYRALPAAEQALLNKRQTPGVRPGRAAMDLLKRLYTEVTGTAVPKYGRGRGPKVRGGIHIDDVNRSLKSKNPRRSSKADFVRQVWERQAPTMPSMPEGFGPLEGLEGPFRLRSGAIVYYDPREGKYYDRGRDMYLGADEYEAHTRARKRRNPHCYKNPVDEAPTVEKVVEFYQREPSIWHAFVGDQFVDMAKGGFGDFHYTKSSDGEWTNTTVRQHFYPGWTDSMFRTVLNAVGTKRRNPEPVNLAALPLNVTVQIGGKKVRRVGAKHAVVNGRRYTMATAQKKVTQ